MHIAERSVLLRVHSGLQDIHSLTPLLRGTTGTSATVLQACGAWLGKAAIGVLALLAGDRRVCAPSSIQHV